MHEDTFWFFKKGQREASPKALENAVDTLNCRRIEND